MTALRRPAALAVVVAAVAACGGSDEGTGSLPVETGRAETNATTTSGTGPSAGLRVSVRAGLPLRVGRQGPRVETLQRALAALGYSAGEPDGIFGEQTRRAVIAFQRNSGLRTDGIVGRRTANAINRELAKG